MPSLKKIGNLAGVFIVVLVLAFFAFFKGKPTAKSWNPLAKVDPTTLSRLVIEDPTGSIEFEQINSKWELTLPVQDWVDSSRFDAVLSALRSFSIGSIVSESTDNYKKFQVHDDTGRRVRVFQIEKEDPVLDFYLGKQAHSYGVSYLRLTNQVPVYLVNDLSLFQVGVNAHTFRLKDLIPMNMDLALKINLSSINKSLSLKKSSDTWSYANVERQIDQAWVRELLTKISALKVLEFDDGGKRKDNFGFDQPFLKIAVDSEDDNYEADIGKKGPKADEKKKEFQYARTTGRKAILLIRQEDAKALFTFFNAKI